MYEPPGAGSRKALTQFFPGLHTNSLRTRVPGIDAQTSQVRLNRPPNALRPPGLDADSEHIVTRGSFGAVPIRVSIHFTCIISDPDG